MPISTLFRQRQPGLRTLLTLMALLLSTLVAGVLAALRTTQLDEQAQAATGALGLQQAAGVMAAVDSDLGRFGQELQAQARLIEELRLLDQPQRLQALVARLYAGPSFGWAGVTDAQGSVRAALDGLLVDVNVSQRDWWGAGRRGLHFGDVHEAKLLAGLLPQLHSGEPWRFVDVAVPLRGADGGFAGVLALHLSWPWLRERIGLYARTAPAQGAQLFIAGRDGRQRLGPGGEAGAPLPPAVVSSPEGWALLQWPDGRHYVTAWSASRGSAPYPGLGWVALVRTPVEAVHAANATAARWTWGAAALGVAGTTALAWLLSTLVLLPLRQFVARVRSIAGGASVPPPRLLPAEFARMHEVVLELVQRLHEKEAALRASLEDVRGGFDSVGRALPGILLTRVHGPDGVHYSHLSASAPHYLGVPRDEILADRGDRAWLRRVEAEDARRIAALLLRVDAGEALDFDFRVLGDDGRWRCLHAMLVPREDGPATARRVVDGIVLDVTALQEARAQAQRASEAKDRFLATMSHELRTPLNALLGYTQLLRTRLADAEDRHDAERIGQAGEQLLRILNEVLDLTKVEAGRMELEQLPLRLEAVLQNCHELFAPNAAARGLQLALALPPRPLPWVLGDAARLQQVLSNLLSNALKFTHEGSVMLALAVEDGALGPGPLWVRLEVRDSGIGLSEEQKRRLFEPFQQADSATARRYGGTGLGLWISRRLAQAMGGDVELDSAPGQGTTVRLRLPFEPAPDAAVARAAGAAVPAAPSAAAGLRVLVVDDVAINREVLGALLRHLGHGVEECGDGESAIERLAAQDIDLVLLDVEMPGMDGLEAARAIRALPGAAGRVPLWAVTGRAYEQDVAQVQAAGMDGHLSKPVNLAALGEVLRAVQARRNGTAAP
ncbi:ATP-binding protein [Azohydromonas australica]|uniref:ATP-binding protein n=1 Tax=Azohydromonas australica TaxID=364039 RepID=UPI0003FEEE49|nr:ATP-binding protein [Azohydromonas australica]